MEPWETENFWDNLSQLVDHFQGATPVDFWNMI